MRYGVKYFDVFELSYVIGNFSVLTFKKSSAPANNDSTTSTEQQLQQQLQQP
jgi:hypothetical protein